MRQLGRLALGFCLCARPCDARTSSSLSVVSCIGNFRCALSGWCLVGYSVYGVRSKVLFLSIAVLSDRCCRGQ